MSKHTPGPWMKTTENKGAIPEHFRPLVVTNHGGDRVVARLPDGWGEEDRGNAVLIAAAPELLAACKDALKTSKWIAAKYGIHPPGQQRILKAAIAKAEGRRER